MPRQLNPILVLVCCLLPGCMSAPPIDLTARKPTTDVEIDSQSSSDFDFNLNDPTDGQRMLASIDRETLVQEIVQTAPGSLVRVVDEFDRSYTGTLLKGSADSVELMNCVTKEPVPSPGGQLQCKTSHFPMQSFQTSALNGFTAFSPPPPDFVAPDLTEDGSSITMAGIIYKDGRSQRWGQSPKRDQ